MNIEPLYNLLNLQSYKNDLARSLQYIKKNKKQLVYSGVGPTEFRSKLLNAVISVNLPTDILLRDDIHRFLYHCFQSHKAPWDNVEVDVNNSIPKLRNKLLQIKESCLEKLLNHNFDILPIDSMFYSLNQAKLSIQEITDLFFLERQACITLGSLKDVWTLGHSIHELNKHLPFLQALSKKLAKSGVDYRADIESFKKSVNEVLKCTGDLFEEISNFVIEDKNLYLYQFYLQMNKVTLDLNFVPNQKNFLYIDENCTTGRWNGFVYAFNSTQSKIIYALLQLPEFKGDKYQLDELLDDLGGDYKYYAFKDEPYYKQLILGKDGVTILNISGYSYF